EWRPPIRRGRLLTGAQLVGEPVAKRELGAQHDALAVDMESAVVAATCAKRGVPFWCVRALSDRQDMVLSKELAELIWEGRVAPWRLVKTCMRSPGIVRELWRLAGHSRHAACQLATALGELLTLTLPGGAKL